MRLRLFHVDPLAIRVVVFLLLRDLSHSEVLTPRHAEVEVTHAERRQHRLRFVEVPRGLGADGGVVEGAVEDLSIVAIGTPPLRPPHPEEGILVNVGQYIRHGEAVEDIDTQPSGSHALRLRQQPVDRKLLGADLCEVLPSDEVILGSRTQPPPSRAVSSSSKGSSIRSRKTQSARQIPNCNALTTQITSR